MEDGGEEGGDVVCLDDAAGAPDLHDILEVDAPFILLVCYVDDTYSLYISCETGGVDGETQVFDEGVLLRGAGEAELLGEEGAVESLGDVLALPAEGGDDAEIMSC